MKIEVLSTRMITMKRMRTNRNKAIKQSEKKKMMMKKKTPMTVVAEAEVAEAVAVILWPSSWEVIQAAGK